MDIFILCSKMMSLDVYAKAYENHNFMGLQALDTDNFEGEDFSMPKKPFSKIKCSHFLE